MITKHNLHFLLNMMLEFRASVISETTDKFVK